MGKDAAAADRGRVLAPVLKYTLLGLICLIAFSIRLFAVVRWESVRAARAAGAALLCHLHCTTTCWTPCPPPSRVCAGHS